MHMIEKILNNTTPYGKIRASHEGSLHSSTLNGLRDCIRLHSDWTQRRQFDGVKPVALVLEYMLINRTIQMCHYVFFPKL